MLVKAILTVILFMSLFLGKETEAYSKTVYLTFDDGPLGGTENVLDALEETKTPGTFFLVGMHIETTGLKKLLPRIRKHGIGNHSYSHWAKESDYAKRTPRQYVEDFKKADSLILDGSGKAAKCRLPGNLPTQKARFVRALEEDGREVIGWDVEINSSLTKRPDDAARSILSSGKETVIVLFHDIHFYRETGKQDLARIIRLLNEAGCTFKKL